MYIETPSIGYILQEEFIEPYGITAYRLAKDINVPTSRILEILHGKRRISIETGLKLARYFGTSEKYFINLQTDIDLRKEKHKHMEELKKIDKIKLPT
ncbi:MAG: HigA family addiction module antitoxin [Bacillota bacterium]